MKTAIKQALLVYLVARIILTVWSIIIPVVIPETNALTTKVYVSQPQLTEGINGVLMGPWQRWDTNRYMRIAEAGYSEEANSVFPPLYPMATRGLGYLFGGGTVANLWAATLISNLAFIGLLIMLFIVTEHEFEQSSAKRSLIYLTFFPTGFFLLAPYTESLFIFFALASIWAARHNGRFVLAGIIGFLASLTRLTGWILVIPLAYEWWQQWGKPYFLHMRTSHSQISQKNEKDSRAHSTKLFYGLINLVAVGLPGLGTVTFLIWRWAVGIPSLPTIYKEYWYQTTGIPGIDLINTVQTLFFSNSPQQHNITLWFDFFCVILIVVTTYFVFRRKNVTFGLYSVMLLFFMLLPISELKPINSFSRYTLAFFPTFIILAQAGKNSWRNRLILYPSFILYLIFSANYFIWSWIA